MKSVIALITAGFFSVTAFAADAPKKEEKKPEAKAAAASPAPAKAEAKPAAKKDEGKK